MLANLATMLLSDTDGPITVVLISSLIGIMAISEAVRALGYL